MGAWIVSSPMITLAISVMVTALSRRQRAIAQPAIGGEWKGVNNHAQFGIVWRFWPGGCGRQLDAEGPELIQGRR